MSRRNHTYQALHRDCALSKNITQLQDATHALPQFGIDQYIIQKYNDKLFQVRLQHPVHQTHECGRSISESKGYHYEFVMAISHSASSRMYVLLIDHVDGAGPANMSRGSPW